MHLSQINEIATCQFVLPSHSNEEHKRMKLDCASLKWGGNNFAEVFLCMVNGPSPQTIFTQ